MITPGAQLSECRTYRYDLRRVWGDASRYVLFVMLNPSTADETQDDPTIRRCIGYAKTWGYGACVIVNAFAFRSTDPAALNTCGAPVGPECDDYIFRHARGADKVVVAWGVHGKIRNRGKSLAKRLREGGVELFCLGTTKDNHPKHPLYLRADLVPVPYDERRRIVSHDIPPADATDAPSGPRVCN